MDSTAREDPAQILPTTDVISQAVRSSSRAVRRSLMRPISLTIDAINAIASPAQDQSANVEETFKSLEKEQNPPYHALTAILRSSSRAARHSIIEPLSHAFHSFNQDQAPSSGPRDHGYTYYMDPVHDPLGAWLPTPVAERPVFEASTARSRSPSPVVPFCNRMKEKVSEFFTLPVGSVTELIPPIYYVPPGWKESRSRKAVRKIKEAAGKVSKGMKKGFNKVMGKE